MSAATAVTVFIGAAIFDGDRLHEDAALVVEDGVVRSMTANHLRQDTGNAPEEFTRLKRSSRNPGAHKVGSEYWITDPDLGDPTETTRGHSDYFHDPVWPRVVADTVKTLLAAPDSETSSKV